MNFKHKKPREYYRLLVRALGSPTGKGENFVVWENVRGYSQIKLVDESVKHSFPKEHRDFVYSQNKLRGVKMTPEKACALMKVSGSIGIDLLKQEVWARCGGLTANDVTLSFVYDYLKNRTRATKKEYARRINNDVITDKRRFYIHSRIRT